MSGQIENGSFDPSRLNADLIAFMKEGPSSNNHYGMGVPRPSSAGDTQFVSKASYLVHDEEFTGLNKPCGEYENNHKRVIQSSNFTPSLHTH